MCIKPVFSGWDKSGTLISKFEEKLWDIDIKNITVSHCDHTKCIINGFRPLLGRIFADKIAPNPLAHDRPGDRVQGDRLEGD